MTEGAEITLVRPEVCEASRENAQLTRRADQGAEREAKAVARRLPGQFAFAAAVGRRCER